MINNLHTVNEATEYFDSLDFRVKAIDKAMAETVTETDPTLKDDWAAFWKRWDAMATKVRLRLGYLMATNPLLLLSSSARDVFPDEADFKAVQDAWSPTYPSFTDKDGTGLQGRLEAIRPGVVVLKEQPKQNSLDVDLKLYQASDSAIKKGEDTATSFVKENWGKGLVLGGLVLGGAIVYKKL